MNAESLYCYRAFVERVIDGDSVILDFDCGMNMCIKGQRVRLAGINTPELRGDDKVAGHAAKTWLADRIEGKNVFVKTDKDIKGRYGRWIVWISDDECVDDISINQELLDNGMAVVPDYLK